MYLQNYREEKNLLFIHAHIVKENAQFLKKKRKRRRATIAYGSSTQKVDKEKKNPNLTLTKPVHNEHWSDHKQNHYILQQINLFKQNQSPAP